MFAWSGTEDAEDVFQDTWLKVWKRRRTINFDKKLRAWVFTIAINCSRDLWRKRGSEPASFSEDELIRDIPDKKCSDPNRLEQSSREFSQIAMLRVICEVLDERDQRILQEWCNAKDEKWISEDLAIDLGMTPNAIRVRLCRLLKFIRTFLIKGEEDRE